MKTYSKIVSVILILTLCVGFILYQRYNHTKTQLEWQKSNEKYIIDSLNANYLKQLTDTLKKSIKKDIDTIVVYREKINIKKNNADSLLSEYNHERSLQRCDSALNSFVDLSINQQNQIDRQCAVIEKQSFLIDKHDSIFILKDKMLFNSRKANYDLKKKYHKCKQNRLHLGLHVGSGINTNLIGGDWRLGHSITVGLTWKFRVR